jgi:hypothetical protein
MKAASSISSLAIALATLSLAVAAAEPSAPATQATGRSLSWFGDPGSPDISGVWLLEVPATSPADASAGSRSPEGWTPWPPPLRGAFATTWKSRIAAAKSGQRSDDPVKACLPAGMPRFITGMRGPLLIVQTPGRVAMTREFGPPRRIWLDGRSLPEADNLEQFFSGNSVGRYEGDALVVDTIGVKDLPIDSTGVPHSNKLVIRERYRRVSRDVLSVEVVVSDELALRRPMRTSLTFKAHADPLWELQDLVCVPDKSWHPELYVH